MRRSHSTARKGPATLQAEITSPKDAVFDLVPTKPALAIENQNTGTQKLVVRVKDKVSSARLEVVLR